MGSKPKHAAMVPRASSSSSAAAAAAAPPAADYNQAVGVAVDALLERAPNPRRCERGEVFKGPVTVLVDVKDESGAVIGQVERPITLSDAKNAKGGFHARVQAINAWLAAAQPDLPLIPEYCAGWAVPGVYLRTDKDGKRKDECMADFPSQKRWSGEWWRFWREHIEPAIAGKVRGPPRKSVYQNLSDLREGPAPAPESADAASGHRAKRQKLGPAASPGVSALLACR